MSAEALQWRTTPASDFVSLRHAPALAHQREVHALWNMKLVPMLSNSQTRGRFAGAALGCPVRSCAGLAELDGNAVTHAYRNPDAIENIFCLEGDVRVEFGRNWAHAVTLGRFDMLSMPADVKHRIRNLSSNPSKLILVLNAGPESRYPAVFDASAIPQGLDAQALLALGVGVDETEGEDTDLQEMQSRVTRFETLVPYKKRLSKTAGIPLEATEMLSAGSVYPLIAPKGHGGRQTAPMCGAGGLYIAIAESVPGHDGPPPHAHSDTQENFFVLDGSCDIMTGFANEHRSAAKPGDLFAMPPKVMRAFRNTGNDNARLLVIIQGPERMDDTISFSTAIGQKVARRFGREILEAYRNIKMTFDAEERLQAATGAAYA